MRKKILFFAALTLAIAAGCKTDFLEEMKSFEKYDDSIFETELQTGWYIDRLYNYYFVNYRNPQQSIVGLYNDNRARMTEEIGGTVTSYTNPTTNLQLASQADGYFGNPVAANVQNNPYTRIRFATFLIQRIDQSGPGLSESFRTAAKGQMYFLRALQYFDLVRVYGGVPLVTTVQQNSGTDETIRQPRATAAECFDLIVSDLDSAALLLPMRWDAANYGRLTAAGALAMKSRVLLTAASPLYNKDWDNSGSQKWQRALDAGLDAETKLSAAGYGLFGSNAKDWAEMTFRADNAFNSEALMVFLLSTTPTSSVGYNNNWENSVRPASYRGGGGIAATKEMLDLFPMADGSRPSVTNYVDTFFFENREPRFYRTFAFSGSKWGIKGNDNKSTWFYRWKANATANNGTFFGNNQVNSPALVRKMSNPAADSVNFAFSGTDIFEYRYAELLLNIAECYAAKGDPNNAAAYIGKVRQRVGIPTANNYGLGTLTTKYAAIEACLYERRIELAYEGKRFWDVHRWMLYDNLQESGNSVQKLGLAPINGTKRTGYYWQSKTFARDPLTPALRNILIDPDAANFTTEIAKLKDVYRTYFTRAPLDQEWDRVNNAPVTILFRPNYYISGLTATVLGNNSYLQQTKGWLDYSGGMGTFDYQQ
ncbi:RagB/SusD family nutrient uptake outer membrane protein [Sphingobacterium bambusae]|uniref:RagB/SusD family nutrient uptake outer membrane protein n=1 Tax=Sphingobacterium bambusae TaxID=662858 RepID=A0ABW6BHS0_9SPHI|nr:RagB/SusD family nutrient uptake outer membrane protein [Sphingobacterium bambusae]WPL50635.1 RagB/SusD family nutrient uptake outer membrane protein [Sphingobacterium bambusae]